VLSGPKGERLRQTARLDSQEHRIARAMTWLRTNFARKLRIEDLARVAGMGLSTFHRHFHELTAMSPLQFQKQLRLHEARRLMLAEELDAARAALRVGYESAAQFSRDYRRLFGLPPRRDVYALRAGVGAQ
jgi:AraC-like DNA-binding protein